MIPQNCRANGVRPRMPMAVHRKKLAFGIGIAVQHGFGAFDSAPRCQHGSTFGREHGLNGNLLVRRDKMNISAA
jgi:hypothetical protein